jgi:ubiquinone/menaquinone biosynthesis C-methylase UbiE
MQNNYPSREYFQNVANDWDHLRQSYFSEDIRDLAIRSAYLHPLSIVADIGGGTGFLSQGLAPLVNKVILIDGSQEMINVARQNLAAFSNIDFYLAEGLTLPLQDTSVDAAFANMYLHHCPDPAKAIQEMVRILRPGGRLVISDLEKHPYTWLKEKLQDTWQGFDPEQIRNWYQQAGLVNILQNSSGQGCCSSKAADSESKASDDSVNIPIQLAVGTKSVPDVSRSVQSDYASHAVNNSCCGGSSSGGSCCGDGNSDIMCCDSSTLPVYSQEMLANIPEDAANLILGCGTPLSFARLEPGEVVVDIGSGAGLEVMISARQVGESGKAIGIDLTPQMVERAQSSARQSGQQNIEFKLGSAESLPLPDCSADVVISNCVINLASDKAQVFSEISRILKPGGRLVISDMVTSISLPTRISSDADSWPGCVAGALPEGEYLQLIAQSGMQEPEVINRLPSGDVAGVKVSSITVISRKSKASRCCCG